MSLSVKLAARVALAGLAFAAARREPALRPVAWTLAALALLDGLGVAAVPWLAAGRHVAWPGVLLAGAWWGLGATLRRSRRVAPVVLLGGYLLAALAVGALYRPGAGLPAARAARVVAAVGLVVLLARRRPATWAELAAVVPLAGATVGLAVGVWPLSQAGAEAVAAGWGLARAETWVAMVATAAAIGLAWRAAKRG